MTDKECSLFERWRTTKLLRPMISFGCVVFRWKGNQTNHEEIEETEHARVEKPDQPMMDPITFNQRVRDPRCDDQLACINNNGSVQTPSIWKRRIERELVMNIVRFNHTDGA